MTKKIIFAVLMLCMSVAFTMQAAPITLEQAKQEAASFVLDRQKASRTLTIVSQANSKLKGANSNAAYYVFNVGQNQGFVIVSGDNRTNPILGYSDEGYFDETNIPANMKAWLEDYALQIAQLDKISDADLKKALAAPKTANVVETRNSIAPLITTKWDQARPYWNKCPQFMVSDNEEDGYELAYTGCVATAMAQIMNYHKHPAQTTQVIPSYTYTYYNTYSEEYGTVTTDPLPVTTFDWTHMKDSYNGSEEEVYTDAVATLMLYAGSAAEMKYNVTASSTTDPKIPKAFHNYLDYNAQLVYRSDYDQNAWTEMVYQELVAGRPMIYNGRAGSGGGHSFICDGYEYGEYYHINWGWGGLGNGYFQLAILNPYAAGIGASTSAEGYNIDQTAIIGIKPGYSGQAEVSHLLTVYNMYSYGGSSSYGFDRNDSGYFTLTKRRYIKVTAEDHIDDGTKYKRGIALYDSNDNFIELIASTNYYSSTLSITDSWPDTQSSETYSFGKNISNGTYKIKPVCQEQNTSDWTPMLESYRYYVEMTVNGNNAIFTDHPLNDLTATNFEFVGDHKVGSAEKCNVTVQNNSGDRFNGRLHLYVSNEQLDEYSEFTTMVEAEIPAYGTSVVTFNFTPQNAGSKTAQLSLYDSSMGGSKIPGTGSVTITGASEVVPMDLSVVIEATNAIDGVIYDTHVRFKVDVTNNADGEFNRYLLAPLFIVNKDESGNVSGGTMITYQQTTLQIPAHETVTLYYDFDNLAYGSTYALNMYGRNENEQTVNLVEKGQSVYYDVRRGLVTWDGTSMVGISGPAGGNITIPDDALAASLEGLEITSVTPSGNPNTIYFIGDNESIPNGLAGLNVVKGNTATSIRLEDGFGYFIPQSFTAQSISYERTFTKAREKNKAQNWSTIVLPFAAKNITANGNDIDWYHSDEETGKAMWIESFAQENDEIVTFDHAEDLEANVPYIIAIDKGANLINTPITWSASNVLLKAEPIAYTSGENYLMAGSFIGQNLAEVYIVDSDGAVAKWTNGTRGNYNVEPFRAYFKELVTDDNHSDILLPGEKVITAITNINVDNVRNNNIYYNLMGQPVSNPTPGIYIKNGQKVIVR